MISIVKTEDVEHTASGDAEIVQVVIYLLGRGAKEITILKDAYGEARKEDDWRDTVGD